MGVLTRPQKLVLGWLTGAVLAAGIITWAGEAALGAFAVPMAPAATVHL